MQKTAQFSIFIIIGALLLLGFVFITIGNKIDNSGNMDKLSLENEFKPVRDYIEACAESSLEEAMRKVGINSVNDMEDYLVASVQECTNGFGIFEGVSVQEGIVSANITYTQDRENLNIILSYPVNLEKGSATVTYKDIYFSKALTNEIKLNSNEKILFSKN